MLFTYPSGIQKNPECFFRITNEQLCSYNFVREYRLVKVKPNSDLAQKHLEKSEYNAEVMRLLEESKIAEREYTIMGSVKMEVQNETI